MRKTPEQIAAETPDSITTTDNAIFRIKKDLEMLIKEGHFADDTITIPAKTLVRIVDKGCNLDPDGRTMIRYKDENYEVGNVHLEYVSGELGSRVDEEE
jgi:hypothetical protein